MYVICNMKELLPSMWRYLLSFLLVPACCSLDFTELGSHPKIHTVSLSPICCFLLNLHCCWWMDVGMLEGHLMASGWMCLFCWNSSKSHMCLTSYSSTIYMQQFMIKYFPLPSLFPLAFTALLSWWSYCHVLLIGLLAGSFYDCMTPMLASHCYPWWRGWSHTLWLHS